MKKSVFAIVLLFTYITSAYALFDSKKIKELETENAKLKKENSTLRTENSKLKKEIGNLKEDPSLYQIFKQAAEEAAERESKEISVPINTVEIIQANYDSENNYKIYTNIEVKNKNKFPVRVYITIEVRGAGDMEEFIYEKHNIDGYIAAGETKIITEDFYKSADNGVTFNTIITDVVKY